MIKEEIITIHKGEVLLVSGPSAAKVFSGSAYCLGKQFKDLIIRKGKSLPIETEEESTSIKLTLYEDASYKVFKGGLGYSIWAEEINKYISKFGKEVKSIVILGPTDSGKSTLTVILSNLALSRGIKVGIIDGDIGQADLTPPCFIGCKIMREEIYDLRDVRADYILPIGFVDVSIHEKLIIDTIVKGKNLLREAELIIVNTDGFIEGPGVTYKLKLLKELKPDLVFLINSNELKNYFSNLGIEISYLQSPKGVAKSREIRIERREMQYARFLGETNRILLDLKTICLGFLGKKFQYDVEMNFFNEEGYHLRLFNSKDSTIIINDVLRSIFLPIGSLENMLIGIEKEENIAGFGIIEKIFENKVRIRTDVKPKVNTIWLTTIKLINGNEQKIKILKI